MYFLGSGVWRVCKAEFCLFSLAESKWCRELVTQWKSMFEAGRVIVSDEGKRYSLRFLFPINHSVGIHPLLRQPATAAKPH